MAHRRPTKQPRTAPRKPREEPTVQGARDQTDASLRTERRRGDAELEKARSRVDAASDAQGQSARVRATTAIVKARREVDARLRGEGLQPGARAALRQQRAREDAARSEEHLAADSRVQDERQVREQMLGELLHRERASTDRRLLAERVHADGSLAARDSALATVAHELRTLLFGVGAQAASLRLAAERREDPGTLAVSAGLLEASLGQVRGMVADLVDVAALEMGKVALSPRPCDVGGLLGEAWAALAPVALARGVSLEMVPLPAPLRVKADPRRTLQVMANLRSNALKYTPAGGRVEVSAQREGAAVQFCVRDTGPGIPRAHLEHVFRRYWQADSPQREGLGLGLYLCRNLVEAHGGRIWAESAPGQGATLRFTLPAC